MQTNTFVAVNGDKAFIVDPGGSAEKITELLNRLGAKSQAILLTHAHFDHTGAVAELLRIAEAGGVQGLAVFLHRDDEEIICSYKNMGFAVGAKVEPFKPDILLAGGETLNVAGIPLKVIHTPGHTKGSVCYVADGKIFSGDTLFKTSYGRTDFYGGSFAQIKNSIVNKLFRLGGDYEILPGHGEPTSLDFERNNNMIILD